MDIRLPEKVNRIINVLKNNGQEAYAVGGCIRDSILGREPEDWDITTSASPEQVKALFGKTFDTGIEHGTVTVLLGNEGFEVTTYRIDGIYEDSRHPKEVAFTRELKEDLLRRDFTINAMAYNEEEGLVDIFDGREDLNKGIIRCVGDAEERFAEDALRILRAIRFSAQLGFEIEENTKKAIGKKAFSLAHISAERIQVELIKTVLSPYPERLKTAYELGVTQVFLPEFDAMMKTTQETPHHRTGVGEHTLEAMKAIVPDKVLRLTMLFHDVAKPLTKTMDQEGIAHFKGHDSKGADVTKEILKRLKFDNDTLRKVCLLVKYHDCRIAPSPKSIRRLMHAMGEGMFPLYMVVRKADMAAQSDYQYESKAADMNAIEACYKEIKEKEECTSLKMLEVSGSDLIALGVKPGKQIGEMLDRLLEVVLETPEYNKKEILVKIAKTYIS